MKFELILLLLVSVMFTVLAAWNINVMYRLNSASKDYKESEAFEDSCHVSKTYTKVGMGTGIVIMIVAIATLVASAVTVYRNR
jgi:hypothetical protein